LASMHCKVMHAKVEVLEWWKNSGLIK
jgi:hypothetical protein